MFYRFLSKLATQERLEAFPVPLAGSDWQVRTAHMPLPRDYEEKFKPIRPTIDILGVKFFKAPLYTESGERGLRLRFYYGKEVENLPDIWGVEGRLLVSEKFKQVLEQIDDMCHEYIPIECIDREEKSIPSKQPYYWLNQRRFLHIEPSNRIANHFELGFCPIDKEEDFLARVIDTPNLRTQLEKIPIWQHYAKKDMEGRQSQARAVLYMNEDLVYACRKENISGMGSYSQKYGIGEESLCSI